VPVPALSVHLATPSVPTVRLEQSAAIAASITCPAASLEVPNRLPRRLATKPVETPPRSMTHVPRAYWTSQALGTLENLRPTELRKLCSAGVGGEVSVMQSSASVWAPHWFAGTGSADARPVPIDAAVKSVAQSEPGINRDVPFDSTCLSIRIVASDLTQLVRWQPPAVASAFARY
jgi:hypothetical protein